MYKRIYVIIYCLSQIMILMILVGDGRFLLLNFRNLEMIFVVILYKITKLSEKFKASI